MENIESKIKMENIELVIKMPENLYKHIMSMQFYIPGRRSGKTTLGLIIAAIKTGTPLPKGHGDLKDISKINYQSGCFISSEGEPIPIIHKIATIEMIRDWLPTIIEADREAKE